MDRRLFIQCIPLLAVSSGLAAQNRDGSERVDPTSPNAVALGYTRDHRDVASRWRKKAQDSEGLQRCDTCAQFTAEQNGEGRCRIFSGNTVSASGWCNAWTRR